MALDGDELQPDANLSPNAGKWRRRLRKLTPVLGVAMLAAATWIIYHEVVRNSLDDVLSSFARMPRGAVALTIGLCVASFILLALAERSVLQMLHREQPFASVFRSTFVTYGLSNAIGFSYASAPATRARIYRNHLRNREVGVLSAVTAASVSLGALTAAGVSLLAAPPPLPMLSALNHSGLRLLGVCLLAPALLWMVISARRDRIEIWGLRFRALGFRRAALQVVFTTCDWLSTAAILYCFLPHDFGWSYLSFVCAFVAAGLIGAIAGTPGGVGPFEATILSLLPTQNSSAEIVAALVAYRMVFTVLPLLVASALLGLDFWRKTHSAQTY